MRRSAPILLSLATLAAVWAQAASPPSRPAPSRDVAGAGLAALAEAALGAPLMPPHATERSADGAWRLRARSRLTSGPETGWPAAVFLEATPVCEADLDRPDCWRLTRLDLDGAPIAAAGRIAGAPPGTGGTPARR
ncbi:MAG: hypothetical protein VYD87_03655 [Pseudomonadota bacterium]|nr:hypothetical protein [Pseudomonadota bacterium]